MDLMFHLIIGLKRLETFLLHTFSQDSKLYKDGIINKNIDNFSKFYKSSNKINGHTYLSFVMLNKWMEIINHGNNC